VAAVEYDPAQPPGHADEEATGRVLARHQGQLMAIDGVEGVGVGRDRIGNSAIVVFLRDASVAAQVPSQIEGCPVETSVTGIVDAY
jgi:hypothetical protein